MKTILIYLAFAAAMMFLISGAYWLAKHGSYVFWYEDMVKETILEMVKQEAIK